MKKAWWKIALAMVGLMTWAAANAGAAGVPAGFRAVGTDVDPASGLPKLIEHEKTGYRLCLVPAGEFLLGSKEGEGHFTEHPQRRIYLDAYWIGETEVTCAQYAEFLNEKGNRKKGAIKCCNVGGPAVKIVESNGRFNPRAGYEAHPVVEVSWYGARAFARWLGGDLLTEAQWEKAAKGGQEAPWPWGDVWDKNKANTAERLAGVDEFNSFEMFWEWYGPYRENTLDKGDYSDTTVAVKGYPPNGYGLYDMAGNAWEWCLDRFSIEHYERLKDGQRNPPPVKRYGTSYTFSVDGSHWSARDRVIRGGGWNDPSKRARCTHRHLGAQEQFGSFRLGTLGRLLDSATRFAFRKKYLRHYGVGNGLRVVVRPQS